MEIVEQIQELSQDGMVGIDVLTMVFRADGYSDLEIASAYDTMLADQNWAVRTERNIAFFVPVDKVSSV